MARRSGLGLNDCIQEALIQAFTHSVRVYGAPPSTWTQGMQEKTGQKQGPFSWSREGRCQTITAAETEHPRSGPAVKRRGVDNLSQSGQRKRAA